MYSKSETNPEGRLPCRSHYHVRLFFLPLHRRPQHETQGLRRRPPQFKDALIGGEVDEYVSSNGRWALHDVSLEDLGGSIR